MQLRIKSSSAKSSLTSPIPSTALQKARRHISWGPNKVKEFDLTKSLGAVPKSRLVIPGHGVLKRRAASDKNRTQKSPEEEISLMFALPLQSNKKVKNKFLFTTPSSPSTRSQH
jgi:hypothetical protein